MLSKWPCDRLGAGSGCTHLSPNVNWGLGRGGDIMDEWMAENVISRKLQLPFPLGDQ